MNKTVLPEADKNKIEWNKIFSRLETWRKEYGAASEEGSEKKRPAVSEVADDFRATPDPGWAVLVSTILSLRTKDDVTRKTSAALLAKAPDPRTLITLGETEVASLAYPAGFYRTKASQLCRIAGILLEKYAGRVPPDMDALLALPGVGRKTANLVLIEAFDMYGICVDVHVHRICNRAGWISTKTPEETETVLRHILPKKFWKPINGLLVQYGQNVCRPVSPFCSKCVIREFCARNNVEKSR